MSSFFHSALTAKGRSRKAPCGPSTPLEVQLGYPKGTRLLIVHADDLGEAHCVNRATFAAIEAGHVSSASVMVPAPWFPEAAAFARANPQADLGVHLTLTSEWESYGWRPLSPIASVKSLVEPDGRFLHSWPRTPRVDLEEIEMEIRAQLAAAKEAGLAPTHLDSHMEVLLRRGQAIFDVVAKVAREEKLPLHHAREFVSGKRQAAINPLPGEWTLARVVQANEDVGIDDWAAFYDKQLHELPAGVSELIVHLADDDAEMRAMAGGRTSWGAAWRERDVAYVASQHFRDTLDLERIIITSWRAVGSALQCGQ